MIEMVLGVNGSSRPPPALMHVHTETNVLVVDGEVDSTTAPQLAAALVPLIRRGGPVRMDLRAVTFIGSAGLRVLHQAACALGACGRVVLVEPSRVVLRAIEVVGLRAVFDVDDAGGRVR